LGRGGVEIGRSRGGAGIGRGGAGSERRRAGCAAGTGWGRRRDWESWREMGEIRVSTVYIHEMKIDIGPPIGPAKIVSCFGPARRAEVAAQALKDCRAGPALSPIYRA
jgi:hypothetical protein